MLMMTITPWTGRGVTGLLTAALEHANQECLMASLDNIHIPDLGEQ